MAKTKRRHLAALAEKANAKDLTGAEARIASCHEAGPSGTLSYKDDPMIEVRHQRIIFKIPALPPKSTTKTSSVPKITRRPVIRKRKAQGHLDLDLDSKNVPADGAKISKVILKLGRWRREKTIGELQPGEPHHPPLSTIKKTRVSLASPRKRMKLQEVLVRSPIALAIATDSEELGSRLQEDKTYIANGKVTPNVDSEKLSGEPVRSATRSLEATSTCNGDVTNHQVDSQAPSRRRRRGHGVKPIPQIPVPSSAETADQDDGSRTEVSEKEGNFGAGVQKILFQVTINEERENSGNLCTGDSLLLRTSHDEAACDTSQAETQAEQQIAPQSNPTEQHSHHPMHGVPSTTSDHHDQSNKQHLQTFPLAEPEGAYKPQLQVDCLQASLPFDTGENGVFLVIKKEEEVDLSQSADCSVGKENIVLRGAELIKQNTQLALMKKRLDAAGGLRNWLLDKKLGQFVPLFDDRNFDNVTLLQLTMTGLKEMGMIPVGPRRKLMHAVSCLSNRPVP